MSLIPAFELGLWNAWIFILSLLVIWLSFIKLNKEKMEQPRVGKKLKKLFLFLQIIIFVPFIYSVFLPLKIGTVWFYAGFFIYLLGMIFFIAATLVFTLTPKNKPVTKGVYRISRNPMNLSWFLIYIGIGLACISWIFLLCAVILIVIMQKLVVFEESICLGKFGDSYREYMDRTPRWIGIPKSSKSD